MIKLQNAPGGEKFIAALIAAAEEMALAFAGKKDDPVRAHLDKSLVDTQHRLAEHFGEATAIQIIDLLKAATVDRKHEIEAVQGGRA